MVRMIEKDNVIDGKLGSRIKLSNFLMLLSIALIHSLN